MLVNFYCARTGLFFFTLREPLRRCHVRPCASSLLRRAALISPFYLPSVTLSPPLILASSLSLSVAQIYVQRQGSLPGALVRDAGLKSLPFPCCLCQRPGLLCHGFPWKIELNDSQSNIYPDIIPPRDYDMFAERPFMNFLATRGELE